MSPFPENSVRRLSRVIARTIHLVGIAGVFGSAMTLSPAPVYLYLAIISGLVLTVMEAYSGWIWFVQLRGVSLYVKLLFLLLMHFYVEMTIPCLIFVIVISGFFSHAPSWIRYFSLLHGRVVHSQDDLLG